MSDDVYTQKSEPSLFNVVFVAFGTDIAYAEAIALSARRDEEMAA